jgi:hypothetical protein
VCMKCVSSFFGPSPGLFSYLYCPSIHPEVNKQEKKINRQSEERPQ